MQCCRWVTHSQTRGSVGQRRDTKEFHWHPGAPWEFQGACAVRLFLRRVSRCTGLWLAHAGSYKRIEGCANKTFRGYLRENFELLCSDFLTCTRVTLSRKSAICGTRHCTLHRHARTRPISVSHPQGARSRVLNPAAGVGVPPEPRANETLRVGARE